MSEFKNRYRPSRVSPPGETLAELLGDRCITQVELAGRTGLHAKTINEIIKGKAPITPDTALRLETVLKLPAEFWLTREQQYQEYLARARD